MLHIVEISMVLIQARGTLEGHFSPNNEKKEA